MNCRRAQLAFVDLQSGLLQLETAAAIRAHVGGCARCRESWAGMEAALRVLDAIPPEEPSPALQKCFPLILARYRCGPEEGLGRRAIAAIGAGLRVFLMPARPVAQAAVLGAMLLLGFLLGARGEPSVGPATTVGALQRELVSLRAQLESTDRLAGFSADVQGTATERLQHALEVASGTSLDRRALDQLLGRLALEPSINVRLVVLDSLFRHSGRAEVQSGVLAALTREPSPLLQLAMIDFLVAARNRNAESVFQTLSTSDRIDETVREAARFALAQL